MFAVQDDWIQYEAMPVRRAAVRGGAACRQRIPVVRERVPSTAPGPLPRPPRRTRLRLTRRGRVVLVVLPAFAALSAALVAVGPVTAQAAPAPAAPRTVVVGTGDSLWSIAERVAPRRDPRDVVVAIERANGLATADVDAGAVLALPAGVADR